MATNKYLDISTAHLSSETLNGAMHHRIADYDEGVFFYVPEEIDDKCPGDLVTVLKYAKINGCTIVRFDADGDVFDGLPVFDHE